LGRGYAEYGLEGDPEKDVQIMLATLGGSSVFPDTRGCLEWCEERCTIVIAST